MKLARETAPSRRAPLPLDEPIDVFGRLSGDESALDDMARELGRQPGTPRRINTDQATVEKDLARLVLALVDLVRRLMEKQAARRVNAGSLTDDEIERMGETFLKLDQRMTELSAAFGLKREDLNLNLGPLGNLL